MKSISMIIAWNFVFCYEYELLYHRIVMADLPFQVGITCRVEDPAEPGMAKSRASLDAPGVFWMSFFFFFRMEKRTTKIRS